MALGKQPFESGNMIERHLLKRRRRLGTELPLYYRKCTKSNGETEEISIGPSAVNILRLLSVMLMLMITIALGHAPAMLIRLLNAWLR